MEKIKYSICSMIKNEQDYLEEWLDYNFNIGFQRIFLYEDIGSKSHEDIIKKYGNKVVLLKVKDIIDSVDTSKVSETLLNAGAKTQARCYIHFIQNYKDTCDWCAFIDVDEFIRFDEGYSLDKITEEFKDTEGIMMVWNIIGADGKVKKEKGDVQLRFLSSGSLLFSDLGYNFKSLVRMGGNIDFVDVHYVNGSVTPAGDTDRLRVSKEKVWIDHYFTKSWEEWSNKILRRGDAHKNHRVLSEFFLVNPDMKSLLEELINLAITSVNNKIIPLKGNKFLLSGGNENVIQKLKEIHRTLEFI